MRALRAWLLMALMLAVQPALAQEKDPPLPDGLFVLCYHDIPKLDADYYAKIHDNKYDEYLADRGTLVQTIEWLLQHGYRFVDMDAVVAANEGKQPLPDKAVLLTFDDAYASYYEFVFPLLQEYGIPSVLAVVSSWMDNPPENLLQEIMTWDQLREVSDHPLVEIASHTHNLHRGVIYNPQGNDAAAANSRIYDPATETYESTDAYRERLFTDLAQSHQTLTERLGKPPRILAWPYGKYTAAALEEARRAGFKHTFALNNRAASLDNLDVIDRVLVYRNPTIPDLRRWLAHELQLPQHKRILQTNLDLIYDPDPRQTEINLGNLLDRVASMNVSTVYLQAFSDTEGSGNIESVYFPNRILPMRADLFNRVVHQLKTRAEVEVYAWMPMLSIRLPDAEDNRRLRVYEWKEDSVRLSSSWYERLSPFSEEARGHIKQLYADMAANADIDGVIFQDDGYLNDFEDFHPSALRVYLALTENRMIPPSELSPQLSRKWTETKIDTLNALTVELMHEVRQTRPKAVFARTLYAPVVTNPDSETWFAQSYAKSTELYDYAVIMAYPYMEKEPRPVSWLRSLVEIAAAEPQRLEKTVFKIQTYDWNRKHWIDTEALLRWLRALVAAGARHIAYYPDDFTVDQPRQERIRLMLSVDDFPFKER